MVKFGGFKDETSDFEAYVESGGIVEGGRTGITALTIQSSSLSPTGPALVVVGSFSGEEH
ncbi:12514_t:CDS:2 [Gigaspora margarita]|uniref:12514_t:CDS:1 n=1 Tax=Gigaspora margarita TaxID=4874 RepID=A0ABN7V0Z8_GIGMA|nr:12514_t:CDS:2 [Gigaspora margarita]